MNEDYPINPSQPDLSSPHYLTLEEFKDQISALCEENEAIMRQVKVAHDYLRQAMKDQCVPGQDYERLRTLVGRVVADGRPSQCGVDMLVDHELFNDLREEIMKVGPFHVL